MHHHIRSTSLDTSFIPFAQDKESLTLDISSQDQWHSRAITEYTPSNNLHPLKSASLKSPGDITRPSLNRALHRSSSEEIRIDEEESHSVPEDTNADFERVIVHEVKLTDSLAGVALKYGMTVADLRKVNHLWTSDSIHLRQVLYIPLDKASSSCSSQPLHNISKKDMGSFFPPPRKFPSPPHSPLVPQSLSPSSIIQPSLATILSNTADSIISRLSFDSAERTLDRASPNSWQHHAVHELENVSPRPSLDGGLDRLRQYPNSLHVRAFTAWEPLTPDTMAPTNQILPPRPSSSASPSHSIPSIRTIQLAPEPDMKLPNPNTSSPKKPGNRSYSLGQKSIIPSLRTGSNKIRPALNGGLFHSPKLEPHDGIEMD